MGYDLRRGIEALMARSDSQHDGQVSPEQVMSRVRRGRLVRRAAVVSATSAAVVVTAVVVQAAPWRDDPPPPTEPSPPVTSPAPTPTPSASTPAPAPTTTDEPATDGTSTEPLVALTGSGDLVLIDPATGEVTTTVADGVTPAGSISTLELDPAREWVYLDLPPEGPDTGPQVVRVSLSSGTVEQVTPGASPALSPDGQTLAVVAAHGESWSSTGQSDVDLATGRTIASIPDDECADFCPMRVVGGLEWSADGREVYVATGWADEPVGTVIRALDVTAGSPSESLGAARVVGPDLQDGVSGSWSATARTGDGLIVVGGTDIPAAWTGEHDGAGWDGELWDDAEMLAIVDPADGRVTAKQIVPDTTIVHVAASDDGAHVLFVASGYDESTGSAAGTLLRWEVGSPSVEQVADDVLSVTW